MSTSILSTKLYIPPPRPNAVLRPHLLKRLNDGLERKLTLISAPAGFGKTTLVSEWAAQCQRPIAWLSLDTEHNDPMRFLAYLVAALQTVTPAAGSRLQNVFQSPQMPSLEAVLTILLNEITTHLGPFVLVLDDYHTIDDQTVDQALIFLVENQPPQMHLVITTRQDPPLPLARLRARYQMTELRAADLRFTPAETAEFLNRVMGLQLPIPDIAALEKRTEGWVAGLQLAALALQRVLTAPEEQDSSHFIQSFTGSHRFVLDYLLEEVLHRQPANIQTFLLHTAMLDRLCGPLCEAVLLDPNTSGTETLAYLEHNNLFIIPLDNERRWYRYHHLFADLLRQRLRQQQPGRIAELHSRASIWYETNNLEVEAFHHAAAAHDIDRATRLVVGKGMPLQFRGAAVPILDWLASLPTAELDARPMLWVTYASALLAIGRVVGVGEKAQAAEAALQQSPAGAATNELIGRIASIRVTLAVTQHQAETIMAQAHIALTHLHPANLPVRASITWAVGYAHLLRGERDAANEAYAEALSVCQAVGHTVIGTMAAIGLGRIQELNNQLRLATQTYQQALEMAGDPPRPPACDAHLGLARINYEWNDLEAAQQHGQQGAQLARQIENTDRFVACELFLAGLKLAQGDTAGAAIILAQVHHAALQQKFEQIIPEMTAVQVLWLLREGRVTAAAQLAQSLDLPVSQARVHLAQGDGGAALAVLQPWRQQVEARGWLDERLKVILLIALAHQAQGDMETAVYHLADVLVGAEPGGFIRLFVDEGAVMAQLLTAVAARGIAPAYTARLLAVFAGEKQVGEKRPLSHSLIEPLSDRELEVLRLIAQGLSNQEIGGRLFLALDTVKGHNRRIFDKLQVQRRTEAVARARELGLL